MKSIIRKIIENIFSDMFLQFKHDTEFCKSISKLQQSVWEAKTFKDSKFSEIEMLYKAYDIREKAQELDHYYISYLKQITKGKVIHQL